MKKNILTLGVVLTALVFTAFKFMKPKNVNCRTIEHTSDVSNTYLSNDFLELYNIPVEEDLVYKVESRYIATISKSDLNSALSINDILPKKATKSITTYYSSRVSILDDYRETDQREFAESGILTSAQRSLLNSTKDSENIYIKANYKDKIDDSGTLMNRYLTYFISVVPDQQGSYNDGHASLIQYLKNNSEEEVKVIEREGLKAGQVRFIVSKEGIVTDVKLNSTSGYKSVDTKLVELIENIPGGWTAAKNGDGQAVDQELVFFFGLMGC